MIKLGHTFSDLVQHIIMSLKTEVKSKGKWYLYQSSTVHQIGRNLYRNENQQSTPILVSVNATWAHISSPGQRVMDILSRGVAQSKTDVRWSRVHRTENDTSAIPQTVYISQIQTAGYLNNRARELKIQEEICFSLVMKVIKIVMKLFWWFFLISADQDAELLPFMKSMKKLKRVHHQLIWIWDHHLNEILIDRIFHLVFTVERFPEVICEGILKIMSVQSVRLYAILVVIIIIYSRLSTNPDHHHHEGCSLKKMITGKLWTNMNINAIY